MSILFSLYISNIFAQINCQLDDSCTPCKSNFTHPNPGEIVTIQFDATEATCYCNLMIYHQLEACSTCIKNSGENIDVRLDDLIEYQNTCADLGVEFTDSPQIDETTSASNSYIIMKGVIIFISLLNGLAWSLIFYRYYSKRRFKIDNAVSPIVYTKSISNPQYFVKQVGPAAGPIWQDYMQTSINNALSSKNSLSLNCKNLN
ncbi:8671_t:CDS:2 [Funneliformis geosporum]|uniref:17510_t:CDS:1 n=1 Tax=Funneliformis geosporum TaxID=1117311 RepID=A0A9W4SFY3_9GLOM|nr:17510_t:CDS:2 [Funneliformis geosporum]CAI2171029.1 8671_t:CDS:2 [Funneliformis geosporum]